MGLRILRIPTWRGMPAILCHGPKLISYCPFYGGGNKKLSRVIKLSHAFEKLLDRGEVRRNTTRTVCSGVRKFLARKFKGIFDETPTACLRSRGCKFFRAPILMSP